MITKDKFPVVIGVAFVWFTTQFGGGFASGAQLKAFFLNYGIWCLIMPVIAQGIGAIYQWYALRYAHNHQVYDYRSFNDSFYGKFAPVFSNLYELLYFVLLCVAPSVAFATGGATMTALLGIPYWICTVIIGGFIFIVAVFGTNIVRKVASTLSVLIITGLLLIFIPNIFAQWSNIRGNLSVTAAAAAPIGPALWSCFVYACFQLASIGLMPQHAKPFRDQSDARKSMIWGFCVNSVIVMLSTLGLMAVLHLPEYATSAVPVLLLVQTGVGAPILTPIISTLIILGAVSTAVNMIAGVTARVCNKFQPGEFSASEASGRPTKMAILTTLAFTLLALGISQFGLLALVAKGYGYLGYLTIPIVMIPYVVHMIVTKGDTVRPASVAVMAEEQA
ncbi:hypothetical protein AU468_05830 [Alkalispirochaeta sphaeroplastigenens]|uniref:Amino acid permease n=1 Tax=Alkalispirochaeta sphaeroplastigenens TaxID=1187066 RepID=A0A2S4JU76_9SPIO|nr:hypothetical protein [Alkalispirochaeta sphaeroplastigenens]POR03074.1 hypothetical protein AU468_05830 [Alkalispirochaeta sphaeroplastigenens]